MKTTLFATLILAAAAGSDLAQAQGTLTAEHVLCEEQQIGRLARRMVIDNFDDSNLFLWRGGSGGGRFRGLAAFDWRQGNPLDFQLAFELSISGALDRLDPGRPLLPQGTLVRRDAATNLIAVPPSPFYLVNGVTVDLAPGEVDPFFARLSLRLQNLVQPEWGRSVRSGRGIETDELFSACHDQLTELDEKLFLVLSRTLHIDGCFGISLDCPAGVKVTMFRAREPLHYRVNLVSYGLSECGDGRCYGENGPIALELSFEQNAAGQLTTGMARVLPVCTGDLRDEPPGCTSQEVADMKIYFLPPLTPGVEFHLPEAFDIAPFLIWKFSLSDDNVTETTIDWAALLANTAWNEGN
jgi:hypothetical protein